MTLVVAIDGPSGSGKSSVARRVASRLQLAYLDTGATYRAATWWCLEKGVAFDDVVGVAAAVAALPLAMGVDPEAPTVLVPDAPGELARLLTDVGLAGVNLEDLQLEHASGRPVGMAAISVLPSRAEHLERELTARGWRLAS